LDLLNREVAMPSAPSSPSQLEPAFWTQPLAAILSALGTGTTGLSSVEATRRLRRFGPNELQARRERTLLVRFLVRFNNPLVLILLAASAVSAFTGEKVSLFIIGVIVLMSVTLDFIQEVRAASAAERLKKRVAARATVLRDSQPIEIPLSEVVPGDMVQLAAGDVVPADAMLVEARDLFVNQALLTGEAYPAGKDARAPGPPAADLGAATNACSWERPWSAAAHAH
jgi:Mg2+-importing ATPase